MEVYLQIAFLEEFMKKLSTVITAFLICAAVFASTTQFDQTRAECVEPHEHCSEGLACDELCQEELGAADRILVANKNPLVKCFVLKMRADLLLEDVGETKMALILGCGISSIEIKE